MAIIMHYWNENNNRWNSIINFLQTIYIYKMPNGSISLTANLHITQCQLSFLSLLVISNQIMHEQFPTHSIHQLNYTM